MQRLYSQYFYNDDQIGFRILVQEQDGSLWAYQEYSDMATYKGVIRQLYEHLAQGLRLNPLEFNAVINLPASVTA